jgi:hypothetical protein
MPALEYPDLELQEWHPAIIMEAKINNRHLQVMTNRISHVPNNFHCPGCLVLVFMFVHYICMEDDGIVYDTLPIFKGNENMIMEN